jgi:FkbM family methyltransferase
VSVKFPAILSALWSESLRLKFVRCGAFVWRFQALPLAHSFFDTFPPRVLQRSFCGFTLHLDVARANPQKLLYLQGERFIAERHVLRELLTPGMRAVDVGANIGYYALLFAEVLGPKGSIICFEPEPANLVELRRNILRNHLDNVEVIAKAVGNEDGTVSLSSGINGRIARDGKGDFISPVCRLDTILTDEVDFIKIDVEGYEGFVLEGAQRVLHQYRPTLFVELHPALIEPPYSAEGILSFLNSYYPRVDLFALSRQETVADKIVSRYLSYGVRLTRSSALLACGNKQAFWAVCCAH